MKLKALSMKKKPEFSIPNLPNYREFYDTFTELKNDTEVSTELTPTFNCNALVPFVSFQSLEFPKQIRASSGIFSHNPTPNHCKLLCQSFQQGPNSRHFVQLLVFTTSSSNCSTSTIFSLARPVQKEEL